MEATPLLELDRITRRISSEFYLRDISLTLHAGEVHALVGRNAAGKSTLFSVLMGEHPPQQGELRLEGRPVKFSSPEDANRAGLLLVGQNMQLFPSLTVSANIFFGMEPKMSKFLPFLDNRRMERETAELLERMGVDIAPGALLGSLSDAQRQLVSVARAAASRAKVLLLDEPTSMLTGPEKQAFYRAVRGLKAQGRGFLIISHDLEEVLALADTVSVLERGRLARTAPVAGMDEAALVEAVYGIEAGDLYRRDPVEPGEEVLRLEGLSGEGFSDVSLTLRAGRITALTGAAGCGARALMRALGGLRPCAGGLFLCGAPLELGSPVAAAGAGIFLASDEEDERLSKEGERLVMAGCGDGAVTRMRLGARSMTEDLGRTLGGFVMGRRERGEYMTGGNRRRELVERTLQKQGRVYLLCEPTAGIDVPARMQLYYQVNELLKQGAAVLWETSNRDEALGFCDRVAVLRGGRLALEGDCAGLDREAVERAAAGEPPR